MYESVEHMAERFLLEISAIWGEENCGSRVFDKPVPMFGNDRIGLKVYFPEIGKNISFVFGDRNPDPVWWFGEWIKRKREVDNNGS